MATRGSAIFVALVALGVLLPASAGASPVDLFGFGGRGPGMGGAIFSTASGPEAVYYNPAGLGFDRERTFRIGYQTASFDLALNACTPSFEGDEISYECGSQTARAIGAPALNLGFGVPLPLGGIMENRLTIALAFVLPTTSILIADTPNPTDLSFVLVENRAQTVSIQAGMGLRVTDWLSIGYGMLVLSELEGQIDIAPNEAGVLASEAGDELIADYSSVAGILVRPTEDLSLAFVWREASSADYTLPINTDLGDGFIIPVPQLDIRGTAQYDPQQLSFEVSGRPRIGSLQSDLPTLLSAAITWKQWSGFPTPIEYSAVPAYYPEQDAPDFEDTWVLRFGTELTVNLLGEHELIPRMGITLEPTPVPDQTGQHNYLDSNRTIATLGLGWRWESLQLDVVGQWHHMAERTQNKDCGLVTVGDVPMAQPEIPGPQAYENEDGEIVEPTGDELVVPPSYPNSNPGCPEVTHSGDIWFFGLELGVQL